MSRTAFALGLLALLPRAFAAASPPEPISPEERARLEAGEVVLLVAQERIGATVAAAVLVRAPAVKVWRVMADCPRAPEFVPDLRSCRVLEKEGDRRLVEHRVKPHALLPELTYRFEERWQPGRRIDFHRVGGDLSALDGTWRLSAEGESTLVRYRLSIDPGFPVPRWAIRRGLRHDLPRLLAALRDRVEDGR
jgi:ribosome-associated toxin RatA of RatAB toxin-antitoxin module